MNTILLIDGSSYLYRAFHAMPDLRSPDGKPTGAMYGVINMIRRLMHDIRFDYGACIFDAKGKNFRHELFPDYKANRPPMPEELSVQIEPTFQLVRSLGWPLISVAGVEADDVIGTLARQAEQRQWKVVISTGDKDFAQLVNHYISLSNSMNNEELDENGVINKFGVPPAQIIDYLALIGDKIDNVPGVEKCGPKTAVKWLTSYGSLDGVMAHADEIKGNIGEKLRSSLEQLPLSKELITIKCNIDLSDILPNGLDNLQLQKKDTIALKTYFQQHGFRSWLQEIKQSEIDTSVNTQDSASKDILSPNPSNIKRHYQCIVDEKSLTTLIEGLMQAKIVAFDTETDSLNAIEAHLIGMSFSWEPGVAYYLPLTHDYAGAPSQLPLLPTLEKLRHWLEGKEYAKTGQNLKYDRHIMANYNIQIQGIIDDTLLASYVLESHLTHNMDDLAKRHLNETTITYEEICGKGAKQISFAAVDIDTACLYAAEDADITSRLNEVLNGKLTSTMQSVYRNIELPVSKVLFEMERHGVLVDRSSLSKQSQEIGIHMLELEQQIQSLAGQPFNINSPKQLQEILFGKLGIPTKGVRKTPSGGLSTDESVLEKLSMDYPLPKLILEYRGLAKLKSTYTDKLATLINPKSGRIHTNYAQAVVITGRLASNDPNLQNIPIRTPAGRRVREAFIAPTGHWIVSADYSQIELRIMAHLSKDENLCRAFTSGEDIHQATAAEVFGVPLDQVSSEQRRYAKSINFGLIYGMGAYGLASQLQISQSEAKHFIERYFARYPSVANYMQRIRESALQNGYVDTVFGRRLYQPEIKASNANRRAGAERAAINAPMQGTAADLIKMAMISVSAWLESEHLNTKLIMQVHDELVLEVPDSEINAIKQNIPELMANVAQLAVPLVAEVGAGHNWDEAH